MKVTIEGKEITLKHSVRALIIYENITEESFQPRGLKEVLAFFYSTILASDESQSVTYEAFLDFVDEDMSVIQEFTEWIKDSLNITEKAKKKSKPKKAVSK